MNGPARNSGILLDTPWVTLYTPWSRSPVHLALEVVVVTLGALTLVHALRRRREGDLLPLFTWATIFIYGLAMEFLSYNFIENFVHAQFSVMFYHRRLPLYVTAVYPTLLYTGIATARRFRFPLWAEGFVAGLLIVAMDVPFDVAGPTVGWWKWSRTDPLLAYRWCGVPVTSYYWHLAFGGILAALTTAIGPRLRAPRQLVLALPAALITIVLGVVAFLPLHGLAALGVSNGIVVGGAWAVCFAVLLAAPKRPIATPDALLLLLPATFYALHLIVTVGTIPLTHLAFVLAAVAFALAVNIAAHAPAFMHAKRAPAG
ncbi:MAG TPA: hypothetical protein VK550_06965 [Polyangiaceae bacterium]|nr:hypothetical protein [Polyangiaceae bacterium]